MRRSFGGSNGSGRGIGGGGGGGGKGGGGDGVFRAARRVGRAGPRNIPDPLTTNNNNNNNNNCNTNSLTSESIAGLGLSISTANSHPHSSTSPAYNFPSNWPVGPSSSSFCDDYELVYGVEDDGMFDELGFGHVPSPHEAEAALFVLNQGLGSVSHSNSDGDRTPSLGTDSPNRVLNYGVLTKRNGLESSDCDWEEPSLQIYDQRSIHPSGLDRVYDAFHMLQKDPCVQRMVISLSTDKAVWDAVMSNEAVREIRESYNQDNNTLPGSIENSDPPPAPSNVLNWVLDNMRVKLMELIGSITNLMNSLFGRQDQESMKKYPDGFGEKVTTAFMLTTVVLLIVIVTRAHRA